jgi:hypothetical protein
MSADRSITTAFESKFQLIGIGIAADDPHVGKMPVEFQRTLGRQNLQRSHRYRGYGCFHHQRVPRVGETQPQGMVPMVVSNGGR